jgi:predicted membrane-bound dolichyl-phosphate-mannose-protein mannosyltransferase
MSERESREIQLASRPDGIPTAANFTLARTELKPLQDQEVLVRNLFMSVGPYMRGRMNDRKSYVPPFELGKPLDGGAVGEVIESRAKEFKPGDAVTSAIQETQTFDEGFHLAAGYSYLKTGDYTLNREHPPLSKLLCALPLLAMNPALPVNDPAWKSGNLMQIADLFLYENRVGADRMLLAARLMTIVVTLLLGLAMGLWARHKFGEPAALAALFLFAFDPNLIAHGHYVTSDVMAAAGVIAVV